MKFNFKRFLFLTATLCGVGATLLQLLPYEPALELWVKTKFGIWVIPLGIFSISCCVAILELSLFPLLSRVLEVQKIQTELIALKQEKDKLAAELEKYKEDLSMLSNTLLASQSENIQLTSRPTFTSGHDALLAEMKKITKEARQFLYITGARTSNTSYMQEIETRVATCPELIHYRVLHGYPWRKELKVHLQKLRELRPDFSRVRGQPSLFIGCYIPFSKPSGKTNPIKKKEGSRNRETEFFLVINEVSALLVVPSLISPSAFDTGLKITDSIQIQAWKNYVEWLAGQSTALNDIESIAKLPIVDAVP
jgi:hypothetical protein